MPPLAVPLGISLGKSKVTPIEDAVGDYVTSLRALAGLGRLLRVKRQSPNTPNLRTLQDAGQLATLLSALRAETPRRSSSDRAGSEPTTRSGSCSTSVRGWCGPA